MMDNRYDAPGDPRDLECLDPMLGEQIWQRATDDCPPDLRERLEAHLQYCAACRLQAAVEDLVAGGLRTKRLQLPPARDYAAPGWLGAMGMASIAASVVMMLTLAPRPASEALVLRGDDAGMPAIERPVPGEIVHGRRPTLRWTPLAGASSYRVRVTAVDDDFTWMSDVKQSEATVPTDKSLPADTRFRVVVSPVPAHLAPAEGMRTTFRTGSLGAWLGYRLSHSPLASRVPAGAGAAAVVLALVLAMRRRVS